MAEPTERGVFDLDLTLASQEVLSSMEAAATTPQCKAYLFVSGVHAASESRHNTSQLSASGEEGTCSKAENEKAAAFFDWKIGNAGVLGGFGVEGYQMPVIFAKGGRPSISQSNLSAYSVLVTSPAMIRFNVMMRS